MATLFICVFVCWLFVVHQIPFASRPSDPAAVVLLPPQPPPAPQTSPLRFPLSAHFYRSYTISKGVLVLAPFDCCVLIIVRGLRKE